MEIIYVCKVSNNIQFFLGPGKGNKIYSNGFLYNLILKINSF